MSEGRRLATVQQRDYHRMEFRVAARLAAEQRAFTKRVDAMVAHHIIGRQTLDGYTFSVIMRDLDAIYAEWYGRFLGDATARYRRLTVEESRRAWLTPIRSTVADIRRRLPAGVVRAIERAV